MQAHFNLGYELKKVNQCSKAIVHFNKVLALQPDYSKSHLHLSTCYELLGKAELAEQHSLLHTSGQGGEN
ncbi:MAG: Tfp pilus assembly protein PilF [Saprospiraceae bacterium]|jgi:Tfp pilus assembly protein PilF